MNTKSQQGFTLIELVMVIVILGILAATALPRFANMQVDARKASLNGALGAINSAIGIVHAQALLKNQLGATGSVTLETAVPVVYGYPAATKAALQASVNLSTEFTINDPAGTPPTITIDIAGAPTATASTCRITYTEATSTAPASATAATGGC